MLDEPLPAVRVCEAILATAGTDGDLERDHPHTIMLLGHATTHSPTLAVPEECVELGCDHHPEDRWGDTSWECPFPEADAVCGVCSARAGRYAGEWEGQFAVECTVPAPCSVLTTFAARYRVPINGNPRQVP